MALTGRAAVLALLGLVPAVLWPSPATVRVVVLVVLLVLALDVLLAASPTAVDLTRGPATQVRLGESTATTLTVTNVGSRTAYGLLRDAWPPSAGVQPEQHQIAVTEGERIRVTTHLHPTRRGDRVADRVTVRLLGPLRVAGRQRSFVVSGAVRTLHPFPARKHLPSRLAMLRQIDGRSAVRTRGQGTEFDSLRDYVDGDDVRSIDWRATARRRHLVVRTWQPEQYRRIVIVLDTGRTSAGRIGDEPRLDAAMDAALLLTALAGHARDRVQVVAGDRTIRARVTGTERARLLHDTISTLAPIDAQLVETDWALLASTISTMGTHRALVVLLTPLEPAAIEEGLLPVLPALTARHRVLLASVADPAVEVLRVRRDTTAQVYAAAAAEHTLARRQRTADALRQLGVDVLEEPPTTLPPALADRYLALKRNGLL